MGNLCCCCHSKSKDYSVFNRDEADDQKVLLLKTDHPEDGFVQVAATPTPLLKDINFATIDDDDGSNSDDSDSGSVKVELEKLLEDDHEEDQQET